MSHGHRLKFSAIFYVIVMDCMLVIKAASGYAKKCEMRVFRCTSHPYKRVCPSVGLSVQPSVHPSVYRSVTLP